MNLFFLLLLLFGLLVMACVLISDNLDEDGNSKTPFGVLLEATMRGFLVVIALSAFWLVTSLIFSLH
tara:strand:+ start:3556 stop:3756 length:201 start_codon:yes stop_codon:yes gene_type:complete